MAQPTHIKNVAVVGATGHVGKYLTGALVKAGNHTVTALTRTESTNTPPPGTKAAKVDFSSRNSLVSALKGQDVVIITLPVSSPIATLHRDIVLAAAEAGVPWVMPNTWGADFTNREAEDSRPGGMLIPTMLKEIEEAGLNWCGVVCGQWHEWSLALGEFAFGFDIAKREVTFYDDGKTKLNVSTWEKVGEAVAALLSLPVDKAEPGKPKLDDWKNKPVYFDSFSISQRDMLDSLHRVMGTKDSDWHISYQDVKERHEQGMQEMKEGKFSGYPRALYARVFYPDGYGEFSKKEKIVNESLGLEKDDLDQATKRAVDMVESGWKPFAH